MRANRAVRTKSAPNKPPTLSSNFALDASMKRLYLSQDGTVRTPGPGEHGHLDMGRAILGPGWRGDVEETYAAMWNAGWVRVVDSPDTLVAEQWRDGKPVAFDDLPQVQREWLTAHSVQVGKQFV